MDLFFLMVDPFRFLFSSYKGQGSIKLKFTKNYKR